MVPQTKPQVLSSFAWPYAVRRDVSRSWKADSYMEPKKGFWEAWQDEKITQLLMKALPGSGFKAG